MKNSLGYHPETQKNEDDPMTLKNRSRSLVLELDLGSVMVNKHMQFESFATDSFVVMIRKVRTDPEYSEKYE